VNFTISDFDDIRPYQDEEVREVLRRLGKHPTLPAQLKNAVWPKVPKFLDPLASLIFKIGIKRILSKVKTVEDFQKKIIVPQVLDRIVHKTSKALEFSGMLEELSEEHMNDGFLFISNHRDITLDPALLNYILYLNGFKPSEIAFGDNLMMNDVVSDLIRINRSFIVKRGLGIRDQIQASIQLANYIWFSRSKDNSVWIAQREGRAKDGNDQTNVAVLKMINLSQRKLKDGKPFHEFINSLKIVPVSISYEFDPCDRMKAWEMYRKEHRGGHQKGKNEDLASIVAGIKGQKGRIHYHFGKVLNGNFKNEKEVAEAIDISIHTGYKLWPNNYIAYDTVNETLKYADQYTEDQKQDFLARFNRLSPPVRKLAYIQYAYPVKNLERSRKKAKEMDIEIEQNNG
jgi:hypothetical protein